MNSCTPVRERLHESSQSGVQLSSGLKERLKKCGRYHPSPRSTTNKRACSEDDSSLHAPKSKKPCVLQTKPNHSTICSSPVLKGQYDNKHVVETFNPNESEAIKHSSHVSLGQNDHAKPGCSRNQCKNGCTQCKGDNSPPESKCAEPQEKEPDSEKKSNARQIISSLAFKSPMLKQMGTDHERDFTTKGENANQRDANITDDVKTSLVNADTTTPVSKTKSFANTGHFRSKLNFSDSVDCDSGGDNLAAGSRSLVKLRNEKEILNQKVTESDEKLRKLKMVKMYRSKNDLSDLERLIDKWRHVSQTVLRDLHDNLPEPRPSMLEFVQHLQLDTDLLQIELEDE